jgi:hypothetical protein
MMFLKACFVVLCAAILPAASASAFAPGGAAAHLFKQVRADTIFVRSRDRDRSRSRRRRRRSRGRSRDRNGPPGWRRYSSRPHDWQRRGCISIGPIWFCP